MVAARREEERQRISARVLPKMRQGSGTALSAFRPGHVLQRCYATPAVGSAPLAERVFYADLPRTKPAGEQEYPAPTPETARQHLP
jgi:hypothetical protein